MKLPPRLIRRPPPEWTLQTVPLWAWITLGLMVFLLFFPPFLWIWGKWWAWWLAEPLLPRVGG